MCLGWSVRVCLYSSFFSCGERSALNMGGNFMVLGNKSSSPPSLGEQRGALSAKSVLYLEKE